MNDKIENTTDKVKKKKRVYFNFIDLVLILLIVALIGALVYIFSPVSWIRDLMQDHEKTIQYTVELQNVDEAYLNLIKENDIVGNAVTKDNIGTVTAVDYSNKYTEYVLVESKADSEDDAKYSGKLVEYDDKYNVIITITVTADYDEGEGYSVNSTRIAVGEKLSLNFPDFVGTGYCIGLSVSD